MVEDKYKRFEIKPKESVAAGIIRDI